MGLLSQRVPVTQTFKQIRVFMSIKSATIGLLSTDVPVARNR